MAVYSGTPTVNKAWEEGDRQGKLVRVRKNLTITLSTQGGATNNIPVAALGFKAGYVTHVYPELFIDGGSQKRTVWLYTDGTLMYVGDPTEVTDANRSIPADVTGTLTFEIAGAPTS